MALTACGSTEIGRQNCADSAENEIFCIVHSKIKGGGN